MNAGMRAPVFAGQVAVYQPRFSGEGKKLTWRRQAAPIGEDEARIAREQLKTQREERIGSANRWDFWVKFLVTVSATIVGVKANEWWNVDLINATSDQISNGLQWANMERSTADTVAENTTDVGLGAVGGGSMYFLTHYWYGAKRWFAERSANSGELKIVRGEEAAAALAAESTADPAASKDGES